MVDRTYFVRSNLTRAFIGFFYLCNLRGVFSKLYLLPSFIQFDRITENRGADTKNSISRDMTKQQNECAPSEDSAQPGHLPSLIRVFTVRMKKAWVLSYPLSA